MASKECGHLKMSLARAAARAVVTRITIAAVVSGIFTIPARAQQSSPEQPDNYTWLEDIHGERQLAWVKAENARTAAVIEKDAHFAPLQAEALQVLESPDRLPDPEFRNGVVYNTWRDAEHVRGILRRTSLKDYLTTEPKWEIVLDYDALSKADQQSWVGKGLGCLHPDDELCLVVLSAGGEDANTLREIDLKTGKFVEGGFVLARGKQNAEWVDKDTLLIGRDWGPGTMSEAGYPITIRQWKRGQPLESAVEVFRGDVKDNGYGDNPRVLVDGQGHHAVIVERNLSTFAHENYLLLPGGAKKMALPLKARVGGMLDGQLLVEVDEDWTPEGQTNKIVQGSVIALDLAAVEKDPARLNPVVVFAPTAQEFEQSFFHYQEPPDPGHARTCSAARLCLHPEQGPEMDAQAASRARQSQHGSRNVQPDRRPLFCQRRRFLNPAFAVAGRCARWLVRSGQVAEAAV
jgi:prolyl oligopeptidase